MRNCTLTLMAAAAIALCETPMAVAQVSPQGGMFYNPTFGRSFAPRPNGFGGGIQTGPSGEFLHLGRPGGVPAFAAPWLNVPAEPVSLVGSASAVQRGLQLSPLADSSAAANSAAKLPAAGKSASAAALGGGALRGNVPAELHLGMPSGIELPGVGGGTLRHGAAAGGQSPYSRSPRLSEMLTRIAQTRGILLGRRIDVYVGNNVALVEGDVRSAGGRALLASVLSLEPGVRAVANRLTVGGYQPNSTPANGP
jgi:hypothetical protein